MQEKHIQLFILPYAGGSIAAFKRLTDLIDKRIDVITVEYLGRGTRAKEPLAESFWDLMDDAVVYCKERRNVDLPYAVMGYSMGSILSYEIIVRKALAGELKHLFISAEVSPKDRSLELQKEDCLTGERILERAKSLGGINERMIGNKRFADIYIRPMISDYRNFFGYRFGDYTERIEADTTFFYSEEDTALKDVRKWEELIDGSFDYHELGKNHFFINQQYEEMARVINETLC